jgi:superfamily I DNA/RNA helicase
MEWYPRDQFVQGERGAAKLINALNHDVVIEQPLGLRADGVDRAIAELSEQQYRILRYLKHKPRLAIRGPAGSGKTLLALERARDLARSGAETLLLTYNRPLADYLAQEARGISRLEVCNFHQLCHRLAQKAKIAPPRGDAWEEAPGIALDALGIIGGQYDAVIVDEGQVMEDDWWIPIEASLKDPEAGALWVFYDDNQSLYQRPRGLPPGVETQPLTESWRSSRQIFDAVMAYYEGDPVECLGPDGTEVEMIPMNGDLRRSLSRTLHRLIVEQSVPASDIVVLTPRAVDQSAISGGVGQFRLVEAPARPNDIRLSSVRRFLGLEAKIVVALELPRSDHPDFRSLMYVAFSRARAHLVVLGDLTTVSEPPH